MQGKALAGDHPHGELLSILAPCILAQIRDNIRTREADNNAGCLLLLSKLKHATVWSETS